MISIVFDMWLWLKNSNSFELSFKSYCEHGISEMLFIRNKKEHSSKMYFSITLLSSKEFKPVQIDSMVLPLYLPNTNGVSTFTRYVLKNPKSKFRNPKSKYSIQQKENREHHAGDAISGHKSEVYPA
jgi:hypothetical protein